MSYIVLYRMRGLYIIHPVICTVVQSHKNSTFTTHSNGRDEEREEKKVVISPVSLRARFFVSQLFLHS